MKARKRKNRDLWECRAIDPSTGQRRSFYGKTEAEAVAKAREIIVFKPVVNTLADYFFQIYWPRVETQSDAWKAQITYAMDGYVLPHLGDRPIREITRAEVQVVMNLASQRLAPGSVQRIRIVLGGIFKLALVDGVIERSPMLGIRLPEARPKERTVLTMPEIARLVNAADSSTRSAILLMAVAGLRIGETCGARWADISEDDGPVLHVGYQVTQNKGGAVLSDRLKTSSAYRLIPIPKGMHQILVAGRTEESPHIVAPWKKVGFRTPNNVHRDLDLAIERSKIRRATPHELRHGFATQMSVQLGCPGAVLDRLMGHANRSVQARYQHANMRDLREWMERLWETLSTNLYPNGVGYASRELGSS